VVRQLLDIGYVYRGLPRDSEVREDVINPLGLGVSDNLTGGIVVLQRE
jgi:hypothetical protein